MEKSELFFNMIENRTNVMEMSNIAQSKKSKKIELSLKPLWKLSNFVGDKTLLCVDTGMMVHWI